MTAGAGSDMTTKPGCDMTAEQKFARASIALRHMRPFYAAVFQVIEKRPDRQVSGMAVTESRILYNPDYVENLDIQPFLYLALHCVAHISLLHVPRRQGRDAALWNAAADLYVNKLLSDEFRIAGPGGSAKIYGFPDSVMMPADALFSPDIDLAADSVESIYAGLISQVKDNGYRQSEQSGQDCESAFNGVGSGSSPGAKGTREPGEIRISPKAPLDLRDSGDNPAQAAMAANKLLSDAMLRLETMGQAAGNANCRLRVMADKLRNAHTNWRALLQRYLRDATTRDSSWERPDKRMLWQKAIYPSPAANKDKKLQDLKICIDVSGSISDALVEEFYGQVYSLAKRFSVDAELIFWDVAVQEKGSFARFDDLRKLHPHGRGGTDPGCLFRYFDSSACERKPLLTLIFTDGSFTNGWDDARWRRRYKNTIWVLASNFYHQYNPPFGKKAIMH